MREYLFEIFAVGAVVFVLTFIIYSVMRQPDTICVGGYTFAGQNGYGSPQQILDDQGRGIRCQEEASNKIERLEEQVRLAAIAIKDRDDLERERDALLLIGRSLDNTILSHMERGQVVLEYGNLGLDVFDRFRAALREE